MADVYVMVGFKWDIYDRASTTNYNTSFTGLYPADKQAVIMHGVTWVDENKPLGYGYLTAAFQTYSNFLQSNSTTRQAVTGGFIYQSNDTSSDPFVSIDEWGVPAGVAKEIAIFFGGDGDKFTKRPYVYFGASNAAPITNFWRNGQVVFGPNFSADMLPWGSDIDSFPDRGNYSLTLTKVRSVVVTNITFPDGNVLRNSQPIVYVASPITNYSDEAITAHPTLEVSAERTASFTYTEGFDVQWSLGWSFGIPAVAEENGTVTLGFKFEASQQTGTTDRYTFSVPVDVPIKARSAVLCEQLYQKGTLTTKAVMTLQVTYESGIQQVYDMEAMLTTTNAFSAAMNVIPQALPARVMADNPEYHNRRQPPRGSRPYPPRPVPHQA